MGRGRGRADGPWGRGRGGVADCGERAPGQGRGGAAHDATGFPPGFDRTRHSYPVVPGWGRRYTEGETDARPARGGGFARGKAGLPRRDGGGLPVLAGTGRLPGVPCAGGGLPVLAGTAYSAAGGGV